MEINWLTYLQLETLLALTGQEQRKQTNKQTNKQNTNK